MNYLMPPLQANLQGSIDPEHLLLQRLHYYPDKLREKDERAGYWRVGEGKVRNWEGVWGGDTQGSAGSMVAFSSIGSHI